MGWPPLGGSCVRGRPVRATPSPWDSEVLNVRVGLLGEWGPGWTAEAVREENRVEFDVVFVRADGWVDPPAGSAAEDHLYDMEATPGDFRSPEVLTLLGTPSAALLSVAASAFEDGRFHRDPRLRERAGLLYRKWCLDAAGRMLVLRGREDALLVEGRDGDGAFRIDLVAVGGEARGSGAGSDLVRGAMGRPGARGVWRVRASCRNWRAVRFYGKLGFVVRAARTAFHIWV